MQSSRLVRADVADAERGEDVVTIRSEPQAQLIGDMVPDHQGHTSGIVVAVDDPLSLGGVELARLFSESLTSDPVKELGLLLIS